ncbi:L-alanine-DL-glutamate epimerase-like enolase superfamily enzyme [Trinickia symbiotica]|uniref:Mandelate racemase/muconate lactonizing enzyme family protein n=1 Tax=Trinickia symbiotica TaxID=863227 RepID=A0A2N7WT86_9BURK|nr:mandelate racemase/muconate lactonizing enzyme family protein [Trinickia symbiotica]PMS32620.1 mandelate racemase/muconate lactonizing enzyme family protein [Trinickia symbiotica]PPK41016.1 L-alanine-DL-glutamate epimerase-like enolase superfamily enzyme [Trinickia symbiotica]
MKITRLRTKVVQLPIDPPIQGITRPVKSADCVLTFLDTDEGIVGEGLVLTLNNRRLGVVHQMIRDLEDLVIGLDPCLGGTLNARAWKDLNFLGYEGVTIIGLAALDGALWDLRAKAAGLNVAHLIGACRSSVPVYASGALWLGSSIDQLQRDAADLVARGFRAVKTRVGPTDPKRMFERVAAIREAIGPDIGLMVDANQQMTVKQAIHMGRMLEDLNLTWFEEPVACHDHAGEARISDALDVPIASGETVYTHRGILEMLQARSADILMPDLQRMGGPTEFLKAGHLCEAHNVPCASHLFTEMSLPLLATLPSGYYLEHMPWLEPIYRERVELDQDGHAIVPDRAGWGFSFDPEAINRYAVN